MLRRPGASGWDALRARAIVLGLVLVLAATTANASPETLPREAMRQDLHQLADIVERTWAYADDKKQHFGVNPRAIAARLERRLPASSSAREFAAVLEEFVAALQDAHASIYVAGPGEPWPEHEWPFDVVDVKEGLVVKSAAGDAIPTGTALIAIDGEPIDAAIARVAARIPASTPGLRRWLALRKLAYVDGASMRVTLADAEGRRSDATLKTRPAMWRMSGGIESRALEGELGYIRIPRLYPDSPEWYKAKTDEEREQILAVMKNAIRDAFLSFQRSRGLVIDLRGNTGGADTLGTFVAQHLVPGRFSYYETTTRYSPELKKLPGYEEAVASGWSKRWPWWIEADPRISAFARPIAFLIDEACYGGTENFVSAVADNRPGVTFVGRPTGGGNGIPRQIASLEHSRAALTLSVMQVWRPSASLIEGRGVRPHVPVRWTRADVVAGRDPDLEAAIAALTGAKAKKPARRST
jgi:C-terminal processing protease CtpA/Prc